MQRDRFLALALILTVATTGLHAADWLHFGHDTLLTAHARGETSVAPESVADLEFAWGLGCGTTQAITISGSPAIRNGVLYTQIPTSGLAALDARNGELLWQFEPSAAFRASPPVLSVDGVVLYLEGGSRLSQLYAVDGTTGSELWQAGLGFDISSVETAIVTVDEQLEQVYVVEEPFGSGDGRLLALDLASGEVLWHINDATDQLAPNGDAVLLDDGVVFVIAQIDTQVWHEDRVVAVEAASGTVLHRYERPESVVHWEISKHSLCGDRLAVVYCDRSDVLGSESSLVVYDRDSRQPLWQREYPQGVTGRIACNEGAASLFVPTDPVLDALHAGTGAVRWQHSLYGPVYNPSLANGVVFFLSDRNVYAVDENTGGRLARWSLGSDAGETTQVAIADGMVFVSGNGGECDLHAYRLAESSQPLDIDGVVPAAAANAGVGGTYWSTTVWAFHDEATSSTLTLMAGNASQPADESHALTVTVPGGEVVRIDDVLTQIGGVSPPAAVFYRWTGIAPEQGVVTSRTATAAAGGAPGTLGQGIVGVLLADLPEVGSAPIVPLADDAARFRSNLGVVNAAGRGAELVMVIHAADGQDLAEQELTLAPWSWRQVNGVLAGQGLSGERGTYVEVRPREAGSAGRISVYASLVDNASGDPTYLAGQWPTFTRDELLIPVAAHLAGEGGTNWVTDVSAINCWGGETVMAVFQLLAEGHLNWPVVYASRSFTHFAGVHHVLADIVLETFGETSLKGAILSSTAASQCRWSRTYNDRGSSGTFGQGVPALVVGRQRLAGNRVGELIGLEASSRFRSNLGLVNVASRETAVTIELYDADGNLLDTISRTLEPRAMAQLGDPLATHGEVIDGRARVSSDNGVIAYASVVDQSTGDATTVLAEVINAR
jgi:outer membrane protein assembly factor BamB